MTSKEYHSVLESAMLKLGAFIRQREEIEVEIAKLQQFIFATMNMLPDADREKMFENWHEALGRANRREASLTDAIKQILAESPKKWFTVAQVRDRLKANGFDFSSYVSNPLASISTTLKRFKSEDVETSITEGVSMYRWRNLKTAKQLMEQKNKAELYGVIQKMNANPMTGITFTPPPPEEVKDDVIITGESLEDEK